jgi:hypothetical protein
VSLYTEKDYGIAYANWTHLLSAVQEDQNIIPDESHRGSCSVHWCKWYKEFMDPLTLILSRLSHGNLLGRVPLEDRMKSALTEPRLPCEACLS